MIKMIFLFIFLIAIIMSIFKANKSDTNEDSHAKRLNPKAAAEATIWNARIDAERAGIPYNGPIGKGNVHGAWAYTQLYVEKQLVSPSSADFRFGGARDVTYLGNDLYSFNSYVDSKNSYGTKVRAHFSGTIRRTSGGWTIESFSFK